MNIKPIKSHTKSYPGFLTNQNANIYLKSNFVSDSFCGSKPKEKTEKINNSLEHIKSFFASPIEISPTLDLVFDTSKSQYVSVDLKNTELQNDIRIFYDYDLPQEESKKFTQLAKQILYTGKSKINTAIPTKEEIQLDNQLDEIASKLKQNGFISNNKHYTVKFVWKSNPYTALRCALDHNLNTHKF